MELHLLTKIIKLIHESWGLGALGTVSEALHKLNSSETEACCISSRATRVACESTRVASHGSLQRWSGSRDRSREAKLKMKSETLRTPFIIWKQNLFHCFLYCHLNLENTIKSTTLSLLVPSWVELKSKFWDVPEDRYLIILHEFDCALAIIIRK